MGEELSNSCPVEIKGRDGTDGKTGATAGAVIQDMDPAAEIDAGDGAALHTEVTVRKARVLPEAPRSLDRRSIPAYPVDEVLEILQRSVPWSDVRSPKPDLR